MAKKIDVNGLDHYHDKVSAMLASEYSSSKTYAVGDYCFHAGTLYECTTAITTAENWTAGHWTAAKLAEDTSALKTAINGKTFAINFVVDGTGAIKYTDGSVNTSGSTAYGHTGYINVSACYAISYKRVGVTNNTTTIGLAFYDSTKTYIAGVPIAIKQTAVGYLQFLNYVKVPDNASFVRLTTLTDTATYGNFEIYGIPLTKVAADDNNEINTLDSIAAETVAYKISPNSFVDASTGKTVTNYNYERTDFVDISGYEYLIYSKLHQLEQFSNEGIAFYSSNSVESFVSGIQSEIDTSAEYYTESVVKIPEGANFARFTIKRSIDGFYIKAIKPKPLKGLKLSILSASISTFANTGVIPSGNNIYYTGNNAGVTSVNEIWWKVLCNNTGMIPLVIDAWSGSSIAYNYATDSTHSDVNKIPMCSDLRTGRLSSNDVNPDIIIIFGGLNDWSYSEETTTPLGSWNGRTAIDRTAVVSGTSTFAESYASMLYELRKNYPTAIIVASSLNFSCRGTDLGATHVNAMGYTEADYNKVIKEVSEIMGVPYIDIYNIGFTTENYYPTYSEDNSTEPTHPNALGHAIIAKRFINELPRLVKQFK